MYLALFPTPVILRAKTPLFVVVCPVFVPMNQLFNLVTCSSDQTPNSDFFLRKLFCLFLKNSKLGFVIKINSYFDFLILYRKKFRIHKFVDPYIHESPVEP